MELRGHSLGEGTREEVLGTRPGQLWLQSLERELDYFSFTMVPRVSEADHLGMSELLQRGNRSPRPEEAGPKERHLWRTVSILWGGASALRGSYGLAQTAQVPPWEGPSLALRCCSYHLGISPSLLGFPWLDSRDRAGELRTVMPRSLAPRLTSPSPDCRNHHANDGLKQCSVWGLAQQPGVPWGKSVGLPLSTGYLEKENIINILIFPLKKSVLNAFFFSLKISSVFHNA